MPVNFGDDKPEAGAKPQTAAQRRRIMATLGACFAIAVAGLALTMSGADTHSAELADYAERVDTAKAELASLEREKAPSASDVERVYGEAEKAARAVTAFEDGSGAYGDALKVAPNLSAALWFSGTGDAQPTYEFSPSYKIEDGMYPCAWIVRDGKHRVIAYALASYDEKSGQFTFYDTDATVYAKDYIDIIAEGDNA